jgi:hypothetical protein
MPLQEARESTGTSRVRRYRTTCVRPSELTADVRLIRDVSHRLGVVGSERQRWKILAWNREPERELRPISQARSTASCGPPSAGTASSSMRGCQHLEQIESAHATWTQIRRLPRLTVSACASPPDAAWARLALATCDRTRRSNTDGRRHPCQGRARSEGGQLVCNTGSYEGRVSTVVLSLRQRGGEGPRSMPVALILMRRVL